MVEQLSKKFIMCQCQQNELQARKLLLEAFFNEIPWLLLSREIWNIFDALDLFTCRAQAIGLLPLRMG
jgi:hypothetical protein